MEIFHFDRGGDCFAKNIPQTPSRDDNILGRGAQSLSSRDESARKCCDSDKAGEDRSERNNPISSIRITAIKPALESPHRANIFINDKYDFSLDLAQLADFKLKVGQQLTESKLEHYRHASEFGKLYQRALEWVLTRPHSIQETRDYLVRKKFRREQENRQRQRNKDKPKEYRQQFHLKTKPLPTFTNADIEQVMQRLIDRDYLNDVNFTTYYIENRFVKKGISQKRLRQELTKKGITNDIIDRALAETDRDERAELQKIINKKRSKYPDDQKLIQYLMRQGFSYSLILEVIDQ